MEPLFTNSCLLTKEVYKEAYLAITRTRRILVVILSAIILVSSIFEIYWTDDVLFYFFAGFFVLFAVYYFVFFPRRAVNITYQRNQEVYHEETSSTVKFYEDRIETKSSPSNAEATLRYDQIVRIKATRQLYIFTIRQKMLIILDKGKFENINLIEFEHFMKEIAVKAKVML